MTKLVDTVKDFQDAPFDLKNKGSLSDRLTEISRRGKKVVTAGQKYDPGSKYLGFSGVPGVKSRKNIIEDEKSGETARITQENVARTAQEAEYARTHPMPITDSAAEKNKARKQVASQRRNSGRLSTVLSDTLG